MMWSCVCTQLREGVLLKRVAILRDREASFLPYLVLAYHCVRTPDIPRRQRDLTSEPEDFLTRDNEDRIVVQ
jgi:hypothetical protein